jgi:hypothetical protein
MCVWRQQSTFKHNTILLLPLLLPLLPLLLLLPLLQQLLMTTQICYILIENAMLYK